MQRFCGLVSFASLIRLTPAYVYDYSKLIGKCCYPHNMNILWNSSLVGKDISTSIIYAGVWWLGDCLWSLVAGRLLLEFGGWETASGVWRLGDCFWSLVARWLLLEFGPMLIKYTNMFRQSFKMNMFVQGLAYGLPTSGWCLTLVLPIAVKVSHSHQWECKSAQKNHQVSFSMPAQ